MHFKMLQTEHYQPIVKSCRLGGFIYYKPYDVPAYNNFGINETYTSDAGINNYYTREMHHFTALECKYFVIF